MKDSVFRKAIVHAMHRMHFLSDETYLRILFKVMTGSKLNLESPRSFNEKIQWLKLHDRDPRYTGFVDKLAVKAYIAGVLGEEYVPKTYAVWKSTSELALDELPNEFVIKTNHDSGGVVVCRDKLTFAEDAAKEKLRRSLRKNYFWDCREWPYRDVVPCIFAEEYLKTPTGDLVDYKVFRFSNGRMITLVCEDRFNGGGLKKTFFDERWNTLDLSEGGHGVNPSHVCPKHFDSMLDIAKRLGEGMPFVRVDFYECNGRLYFGEMTFYPNGGFERFEPESWNCKFGEWICLPSDGCVEGVSC